MPSIGWVCLISPKTIQMMKSATVWAVGVTMILLMAGCRGSIMKSMVGQYNVDSVTLARYCYTDSALAVVKRSQEHNSVVNKAQGLMLEVVYLQDLDRADEARDLYSEVIKVSPWIKSEKELERNAKKALKDLRKMRKRSGYDPNCAVN